MRELRQQVNKLEQELQTSEQKLMEVAKDKTLNLEQVIHTYYNRKHIIFDL